MSRGVPVELTSFVGRRPELAAGRRMLRAARLVTVVGPGGVGKTRLAQRLARQVERVFPDGVAMVELASLQDPDSLGITVAAALGVDPRGSTAELAVAAYLRTRRLLLVLDNCEHLLDACAGLVRGLVHEAPELRVLATSRQPLGLDGEHVIGLDPLTVPTAEDAARGAVAHVEAVTLLTDRIRAVDRGFRVDGDNAELVARLCRALEGIPLAIELAAPRLRMLSLSQLVDRLDEPLALLTTGPRSGPQRHQTLRAVIDWSHEICSPQEQALWARMSVFDGGAELETVEAVCGAPDAPVTEPLAGLVDKSVVTRVEVDGQVRYGMFETIRDYGAERLAELKETDRVRDRHLDHFLALARQSKASWIGPDQGSWLARVSTDLGNLRAAFEHSLADLRDRTNALQLASSLVWFWSQAGATDEGSRWFAKAVADPDEPSPHLLHGLVAAIVVASDRGDQDTALPLARRAAALPHRRHDADDEAAHHMAVATEALLTGDDAAAATAYGMALACYQSVGDSLGQLECLTTGANLANHLGHPEDGLSMLAQATRLCDAHGELRWRAYLHYSRGDLLWDLGRPVEALGAVRSSLESWSLLEPHIVGAALHVVAWAYVRDGRARQGAVLFGVRQRIRQDLGVQPGPFGLGGPHAVTEAEVIEAIGEDEFGAAHDEGFAMELESAVQLALGRQPMAPTPTQALTLDALSKRELQVAQLLARGRSNQEIAAELVISPRTAEGHVAKVLDKLGAHSRGEVVSRMSQAAVQE